MSRSGRSSGLRQERELTPVALAKLCGVSDGTIHEIEGGTWARRACTSASGYDALGVDARYLAIGDDGLAGRVAALEARVPALEDHRK